MNANSAGNHSSNGFNKKVPASLEKSKLRDSKLGSLDRESFSKDSPPVTPSALTSNNSHSYPSSHNNGNSALNGNSSYSNNSNNAQQPQLADLMDELKMMKSIIIKHETRIRELEKKLIDQNKGSNYYSKPALKSTFGNHDALLPDEV